MSIVVEKEPRELKPEQRLAAHTLDRHVSVTAGPGAGKTTVLVERYLEILRTKEISVDQIVAITFTNRAANEMRERLRAELDALLSTGAPPDRARWMRHKRTLDGAIITTIHGFCSRLLREFPVEADLDPQFTLLEAHQSAMLEESVAEEVLTRMLSEGHPAITELTAAVGRARLVRGLIEVYRASRNQGVTLERLAELTESCHTTREDFDAALQELSTRMGEFLRARGLTSAAETKQRNAADRWPRLRQLLVAAPDSTSLAEVHEAIRQFRDEARPAASARLRDLIEKLDDLIWAKDFRGRVPGSLFDLHAKRYAVELLAAVAQIERRLDEEKRRGSALDFDDLQLQALRLLEQHPEVLRRISARYRFFLVDEFQDTNGLQRDLLNRLALGDTDFSRCDSSPSEPRKLKSAGSAANLFIVGDRKQSIYGFRGADVDVFREMTSRIEARDGLPVPLNRNFRSQNPLIRFFNFLFERIFEHDAALSSAELNELGYVEHEMSVAAREDQDATPVVEVLIDVRPDQSGENKWSREKPRERDAEQLATRINSLVGEEFMSDGGRRRQIAYRDIALLFRAMTEVRLYEAALRRAGIPYVTVQGKGFYARFEVTDFIQLLRFLDNKTDEVALAAVLRSPICGLSDDTLLALRCAPVRSGGAYQPSLHSHAGVRPLLRALRDHEQIEFIEIDQQETVEQARRLLEELVLRSKRSSISELLRFAADASEYRTIAAASFDGAQRLANIEKLFTLAERFEQSGAFLIRDFVRFVRDFEEAGGRESEGQIDESADAVRIMSIHQSKGLEFPVVIIPDLHRLPDNRRDWWALDRHRGLTVKVPDGRGRQVGGWAYQAFSERARLREEFESMRLLYVAATRAENRLILSGAGKAATGMRNSWLARITGALGITVESASGSLNPAHDVELLLTFNLLDAEAARSFEREPAPEHQLEAHAGDESCPLLQPIAADPSNAIHRFSVTQLLNYRRCPRQYYFDRVLHAPGEDELAVWNDAEAPEPPSNLTATIRGAVIHRFCEKYREGDDPGALLIKSVEETLDQRSAQLAERVLEIDVEKAIRDLLPLAENYVASGVRERVEAARAFSPPSSPVALRSPLGSLSEQRFRLRRPLGILSGTIDKLLVTPAMGGAGVDVEIIDFKTNRFRRRREAAAGGRVERSQLSFGFLEAPGGAESGDDLLIRSEIQAIAADYQIQMQAYALAAHELIRDAAHVRVTLHFLDPDVEVSLPESLLAHDACAGAIDEAMMGIVSTSLPDGFPAVAAEHCRMCSFVDLCPQGQDWLHPR